MIRTRFAPSPTGYLHVGGLRTALYAYLFAKKFNGAFILRIEDTDQTRQVKDATENLIKILKYFELNYDEGPDIGGPYEPYIQSQRTQIYQQHTRTLLENNHAYRCFCTKEELGEMRAKQSIKKLPPMYDKRCRYLNKNEIDQKLTQKIPHVVRLKVPENQNIIFKDLIRGMVEVVSNTIDDQVLLKSDGFPTYHLANVVDDHHMKISHVIRAEEWLPSTPKHLILYRAFEWDPPQFAHLPLLLNSDKSKLSKRQGDVAVEDYLKKGYLKEAILNFVALLGWNPGSGQTEEIFSLTELIQKFSLDKVQKAGAIFNIEKLDWMNGLYIRKLPLNQLIKLLIPYLAKEAWFKKIPNEYLEQCVTLEQERIKKLSDAPKLLKFFFVENLEYDQALFLNEKMKVDLNVAKIALENALLALAQLENFHNQESIKESLTKVIAQLQLKNGQVLWPLRVALTGEKYSPGVFEIIRVLGKEKSLQRIKSALKQF